MRRKRHQPALLTVAALLVATAACSGETSDDDASPEPAPSTTTTATSTPPGETTTTPPPQGTLDQIELATQEIAVLEAPTAFAARPSTPDLYVAERAGRVRVIDVTEATSRSRARYQLFNTPIIDLSDEVITDGSEQGLLGLAFSSDGRKLYVNFTAEPDGRTVVLEYEMGDRASVDRSSRRQLLEVEQPFENHNGGDLKVGRDGYLYVSLGDGGSGGDPSGNGQDPTTLLGSILRIDPIGGGADGPAYGIPAGNPFANGEGGAPETWLYGVRNPWRFTFDRETGDMWVADVGQSSWEEINKLPATGGFDAGHGANLGWNEMEGTHSFDGGSNPEGAVLPIHEYSADDGCSVIGGYVYRGDAIGALRGTYLFADYCAPGLQGIQVDGSNVIDARTWELPVEQAQSFGQDNDGELYVLLGTGPVLKLVPPGSEDDD